MKSFLSDKNGLDQKDYVLLFATIIYALVLIPMVYSVLVNPCSYSYDVLNFFIKIIDTASAAYGTIVVFFFGAAKTHDIIRTFRSTEPLSGATTVETLKDTMHEKVSAITKDVGDIALDVAKSAVVSKVSNMNDTGMSGTVKNAVLGKINEDDTDA